MKQPEFRENCGIVFGISIMVVGIVGWSWFIWALAYGFNIWQKMLWVIGSYVVVWGFCKIASIPGVGCIPVKIEGCSTYCCNRNIK